MQALSELALHSGIDAVTHANERGLNRSEQQNFLWLELGWRRKKPLFQEGNRNFSTVEQYISTQAKGSPSDPRRCAKTNPYAERPPAPWTKQK